MATVTIDGECVALPSGVETFGDLLAVLDARLAAERRLVTLLRIDGVDVPAFRDPAIAARPAAGMGRVELTSDTPGALAAGCLREAGEGLEALAGTAEVAALEYRLEDVIAGNRTLVALTEGIATALAITSAASLGLGLDVTRVATPHGTLADLTSGTSGTLDALITAQRASDWNALAARLADDLAPRLRRWGAACRSIGPAQLA